MKGITCSFNCLIGTPGHSSVWQSAHWRHYNIQHKQGQGTLVIVLSVYATHRILPCGTIPNLACSGYPCGSSDTTNSSLQHGSASQYLDDRRRNKRLACFHRHVYSCDAVRSNRLLIHLGAPKHWNTLASAAWEPEQLWGLQLVALLTD